MVEEKKQKVSAAKIAVQVEQIKGALETITAAINDMPDCGAKKAFELTRVNLQKKIDKYSRHVVIQGEVLDDEEKEMLRKFREERTSKNSPVENKEDEISPDDEISDDTQSPAESDGVTKKNKRGKKN